MYNSHGKVVIRKGFMRYSDFKYAKEAITLGIDNYLLKPIHLGELKKTLDKMEQELTVKKQERQMLSLENLFYGIMQDRISIDENLEGILESHYGLKLEEPVHCLFVFSGSAASAAPAASPVPWNADAPPCRIPPSSSAGGYR